MRTLRKRLDSVEAWAVFQQHRELQRQFQGRSRDEKSFFIIHGYWPENADDILPHRLEFTVRGIKTNPYDRKPMEKPEAEGMGRSSAARTYSELTPG
jgi:ribonuclease I